VVGTTGQQKPAATLLDKRVIVPNLAGTIPELDGTQQILLEKQALDCFTNVNLRALLERLGAERYVVYGVVTEICVSLAACGLLKTGKRVELVTDAVRSLDEDAARKALDAFEAQGGILTTEPQVTGAV
jgi:nicotinamidase-related amidase